MVVGGYRLAPLLRKTFKETGDDRISVYAAQMAYTFFFSLFPLLLFGAALLSLVADRQQVLGWMSANVATALPKAVADLLLLTMTQVLGAKNAPGILSFGILTTAWSGSAIFGALMTALNDAFDVVETRPWWKQQVIRLVALAIAGTVLVAATVVLLNGEGVVSWIGDHIGIASATQLVWIVVQYPLALGAVIGVVWLIYYFLPNCRHRQKRQSLVVAIVTTVMWVLGTLLFRLYVQIFPAINPAYGAIGAVMALLTWMYYTMLVLLAGGELTSELEAGTGRVRD
jgi:membrane protein